MEFLILIGLVLVVLFFTLPIVALATTGGLSRRLRELEQRVARTEVEAGAAKQTADRVAERRVTRRRDLQAFSRPPVTWPEPEPADEPVPEAASDWVEPVIVLEPEPEPELAAPAEEPVLRSPGPKQRATERIVQRPGKSPTVEASPIPTGSRAAAIEAAVGGKWLVWIGGVALALAGGFLVHYAYENAWLGETARTVLASVFGLAMIAAAEVVRGRSERVCGALSGAGVAVLYAAVFAAAQMYGLISPLAGFVLAAGVTAGAVALALRHGPVTAVIGLLGGFGMPVLLQSGQPAGGVLFTYLLLLQAGAGAVAWRRRWPWLPPLTVLGALGWAVAAAVGGVPVEDHVWVPLYLAGFGGVWVTMDLLRRGPSTGVPPWSPEATAAGVARWAVSVGAIVGSVVLLAVSAGRVGFGGFDLVMLALAGAGCLALGRLRDRYAGLPAVAAAATLGVLIAYLAESVTGPAYMDATRRFVWWAAGFAVLYGVGGYAAAFGSKRASRWACWPAVAGHVGLLLALAGRWPWTQDSAGWWLAAGGLAVVTAAMTWPWLRKAADRPASALALSSAGFATWAVALGFDHPWLASGWAAVLVAVTAAWVWLRLPALRWAAGWLTAGIAAVLIVPGPTASGVSADTWPVLNELLFAYGLPAVGLAVAAARAARAGARRIVTLIGGASLGVFAFGVAVIVRQGFHGGDWFATPVVWETQTTAAAWLAAGLGLIGLSRIGPAVAGRAVRGAGGLLMLAGTLTATVGGVMLSPVLTPTPVGGLPVVNGLLYLYVLPAGLIAVAAWVTRRSEDRDLVRVLQAASTGLVLIGAWLIVRHGLHDAAWRATVTVWETQTTAVVWCGLGLAAVAAARTLTARPMLTAPAAVVVGLGAVLAAVGGVLLNPVAVPTDVGGLPVLNGLLYLYMLPAAVVAAGAWAVRRAGVRGGERVGQAVVTGLALVGSWLMVRHGLHDGAWRSAVTLWESQATAVVWGGLGLAAVAAAWRWPDALAGVMEAGVAAAWLAVATAIVGGVGVLNPLWHPAAVAGPPAANGLLFLYLLPAGGAALVGVAVHRLGHRPAGEAGRAAGVLLAFAWVSLTVRQGFVGGDAGAMLLSAGFTEAESYAYSLAWVLFGVALLVGGVVARRQSLRYASLAVMLLAVVKVFVFDASGLEDLWRVASFFGLGLSLIGLGYAYHRWVFGPGRLAGPPASRGSAHNSGRGV